jgi:hypothetical protein
VPYPYTLAAAALLASVCIFGGKLRARSHHRRWISIAAGVSVATVFVDLLPEISERQAKSQPTSRLAQPFPRSRPFISQPCWDLSFFTDWNTWWRRRLPENV